jgi:hypothetical protein
MCARRDWIPSGHAEVDGTKMSGTPGTSSTRDMVSLRRNEARPLDVDRLTPVQRELHERILREIAARGRPIGSDALQTAEQDGALGLPRIEGARDSNAIVIDAERGCGKTTLLLKVISDCNKRALTPQRRDPIWGNTVPVATDCLDFVPVSENSSVLALFAQAFDHLVQSLLDRRGEAARAGGTTNDGVFDRLEEHYFDLQRAALSRIEIGAKKSIVESTQRLNEQAGALLSLDDTFRRFIESLDAAYRAARLGPKSEARLVFVLPIDDADAHASRSVELVSLLRAVYHPQLLFLLAGDTRIIHQVLYGRFLEDLVGKSEGQWKKRGSELAKDLALDVLDRVFPPVTRLRLAPLTASDALDLTLDIPTRFAPDGQTSLRKLLATFGDSFPPALLGAASDIRKRPFGHLLPRRLRELVDLATRLQDIASASTDSTRSGRSAALRAASAMLDDAVRRDSSRQFQSVADRVVLTLGATTDEDPIDELDIDVRGLSLEFDEVVVRREVKTWTVASESVHGELECVGLRNVHIEEALSPRSGAERVPLRWPARITDAFLLCMDVREQPTNVRARAWSPRLHRGWSGLRRRWTIAGKPFVIDAPLPEWSSWATLAAFDALWDHWAQSARSEMEEEELAALFALAAIRTTIAAAQPKTNPIDPAKVLVARTAASRAERHEAWSAIGNALNAYLTTPTTTSSDVRGIDSPAKLLRDWMPRAVATLFSPEFSLNPERGKSALEAILLPGNSWSLSSKIAIVRNEWIRGIERQLQRDWRAEVDRFREVLAQQEMPIWRTLVPAKLNSWEQLVAAFDKISIASLPGTRKTLAALLNRTLVKDQSNYRNGDFIEELASVGDPRALALWAAEMISKQHNARELIAFSETGEIRGELAINFGFHSSTYVQFGARELVANGTYVHVPKVGPALVAQVLFNDVVADANIEGMTAILRVGTPPDGTPPSTPIGLSELAWWPNLTLNVDRERGTQRLRAFAPCYPSVLDHELFADSWSKTARELVRRTDPIADRRNAFDNAIVSFLRDAHVVFTDRTSPDEPVKREKHIEYIRELYSVQSNGQTKRERVFDAWRRNVVLFAIPEYGLSPTLCEVLLDAHAVTFGEPVSVGSREATRLRGLRERLLSEGGDNPPDAEVQRIDGAPDHPWMCRVEQLERTPPSLGASEPKKP